MSCWGRIVAKFAPATHAHANGRHGVKSSAEKNVGHQLSMLSVMVALESVFVTVASGTILGPNKRGAHDNAAVNSSDGR